VEDIYTAAEADIDDIVQNLTSMCLGLESTRVPPEALQSKDDDMLNASVTISGAWTGVVGVSCSSILARRAACAMYGTCDDITEEEARDALREIANIIGGNFKSLVSSPSSLSLPEVREQAVGAGGLLPVHRLWFECEGEPLLVTVMPEPGCEADAASGAL
jgi:Chemotaxis phosphatase CheX